MLRIALLCIKYFSHLRLTPSFNLEMFVHVFVWSCDLSRTSCTLLSFYIIINMSFLLLVIRKNNNIICSLIYAHSWIYFRPKPTKWIMQQMLLFWFPTVGVSLNDYKRWRGRITYGLYPSSFLLLDLFLFVWS